ncbi:putative nephrocystin [Rhypophila sp. PSN 637]
MLSACVLITIAEIGDEFEMYRLVQLSTRKWLEVFERQEIFREQFIERMAASFPTGEYGKWTTCRILFAHVQVAVSYQPIAETAQTLAALLHNGGWYAWSQGRYDIAQQMLGKAKKLRRWKEAESLFVQVMETRKRHGQPGVDVQEPGPTLTSMANLASTYRNQGRWKEAESLDLQVMETSSRVLGEEHPDTLTSMGNLASTGTRAGGRRPKTVVWTLK